MSLFGRIFIEGYVSVTVEDDECSVGSCFPDPWTYGSASTGTIRRLLRQCMYGFEVEFFLSRWVLTFNQVGHLKIVWRYFVESIH